jgi:NADH:ubiquinone oxidoreductase subunit 6 (subunit J)
MRWKYGGGKEMTRGTKKLVLAIGSSGLAFLIGIYIFGTAKPIATNSRGPVRREDFSDILTLADPTFREYSTWGNVVVESQTAALLLFVVIPLVTFILTLLFSFPSKKKIQENSKADIAKNAKENNDEINASVASKSKSPNARRFLIFSSIWISWVSLRTATGFELLGYYFHEWDEDMYIVNVMIVPLALLIFGVWKKRKTEVSDSHKL